MRIRQYSRLPLSLAAAIVMLVTGAAHGGNLSFSNQTIRATWPTFTATPQGGVPVIRCPVTMEGTLHSRTFMKSLGSLIGHITRAVMGRPCVGGTGWIYNGTEVNEVLRFTLANSLPWPVYYEGFTGVLPDITGINVAITRSQLLYRATFFTITELCIYRSTTEAAGRAILIVSRGRITEIRLDERAPIPLLLGECPPTGNLSGLGRFSTENVVTLI